MTRKRVNPENIHGKDKRVLRGGCAVNNPKYCRCTVRHAAIPINLYASPIPIFSCLRLVKIKEKKEKNRNSDNKYHW